MLTPPRKKPRRTSSRKLTKREHNLLRRIAAMMETLGVREQQASEAGVFFREGAKLLTELAAWGRLQRVMPPEGAKGSRPPSAPRRPQDQA